MFIGQRGDPWPDTNIMQMLKYNNKMVSFIVMYRQSLPVLQDVNCTDNAQQIFWRENIEWLAIHNG